MTTPQVAILLSAGTIYALVQYLNRRRKQAEENRTETAA